jgi:hypothetical protein
VDDSSSTAELMTAEDCLTLYPKRSSAVWLLLGSSVFVAIGIWMVVSGNWMGYLCAGFFGLCLLVAIGQLLPGSCYLSIRPDGLTFCSLYRGATIRWEDVDRFYVVVLRQRGMTFRKMVGFTYAASYERFQSGRRLAQVVAGCEGGLPDTYGMNAQELADLLNVCLQLFARGPSDTNCDGDSAGPAS